MVNIKSLKKSFPFTLLTICTFSFFNSNPASATIKVNNPYDYSSENQLLLSKYQENFFLPLYFTQKPNFDEYEPLIPPGGHLTEYNINFQISLKYQLLSGLINKKDSIFVTYTQRSNWQAYDKSAYFRDTTYKPSIFWTLPVDPTKNEWNYSGTSIGLVHESNGRGGTYEKSWNRAYIDFNFIKNNFFISVKPWTRVRLGTKDYNKDIMRFLGYGRVSINWKFNQYNLISMNLRNVLESDFSRGYLSMTWNFPIYKRLRGYMIAETGYGISITDYNHYDNAFGIGFSF